MVKHHRKKKKTQARAMAPQAGPKKVRGALLGEPRNGPLLKEVAIDNNLIVDRDPLVQYEQEQLIEKKDTTSFNLKSASLLKRSEYSGLKKGDKTKAFELTWVAPSRREDGSYDARGNPREYMSATLSIYNSLNQEVLIDCTSPLSDPGAPSIITGRSNWGQRRLAPGKTTSYTVNWSGRAMGFPHIVKKSIKGVVYTTINCFNFLGVMENINEATGQAYPDSTNALDVNMSVKYRVSSVFPSGVKTANSGNTLFMTLLDNIDSMYARSSNYSGPFRSAKEFLMREYMQDPPRKQAVEALKNPKDGYSWVRLKWDLKDIPSEFKHGDHIHFPHYGSTGTVCLWRNPPEFSMPEGFYLVNGPFNKDPLLWDNYQGIANYTFDFANPALYYPSVSLDEEDVDKIDWDDVLTWFTVATKVIGLIASIA